MQEKNIGVKRLLRAISDNIDESNIDRLAMLINYDKSQLKQDIDGIQYVEVVNKEN